MTPKNCLNMQRVCIDVVPICILCKNIPINLILSIRYYTRILHVRIVCSIYVPCSWQTITAYLHKCKSEI